MVMKKMVCLLLVLALCLSATAFAEEATPSKTIQDLNKFEVEMENMPPEGADPVVLAPLVVDEMTEEQKAVYQERLDVCDEEVAKLSEAEKPAAYFTSIKDETGKEVTIAELLGTDQVDVFEMCPAVAMGYEDVYGDVTAVMKFATPYEENEQVIVLVGVSEKNDDTDTRTMNWTAYHGEGVSAEENEAMAGGVKVTLKPESVLAIQNDIALIAVVSVKADAVRLENPPKEGMDGIYLIPVNEPTVGDTAAYQDRIDICEVEKAKLDASATEANYFVTVKNAKGETIQMSDLMVDGMKVVEFCPAIAGGFQEAYGAVTTKMLFETEFEKGTEVVLMVGIVTIQEDGTQLVSWTAYDGVAVTSDKAPGCIEVTLNADDVMAIQNGVALLAVLSK